MAREEYIRIYRSDVVGATPSLTSGEIAANLVDGKLFVGGTNGSLITFTTDSNSITGVNGLTGNITLTGDGGAIQGKGNNTFTARVATDSLTGVASFRNTHFTVDTTGHVQLSAAYQVTGQTVVAGYGIDLVSSGNTRTINNRGVTSFNGLTGNVSLTGDGGAVQGKLNNTITTRLTTAAGATGLASFRDTHFLVDATGHVQLAAAYQATGDTVITVVGSGIGIVTSGKTDTLYNIGVTSFNGLTGNVSLTGDGGAVQGKLNNTITTRLTTAAGATGLASFRDTHFLVDATGHVQLAAAYQATGDTVITVVGSGIGIVTSGKTDTLYNIGVTGIGFGNDVGLTGKINLTAGNNITLSRSGNTITIGGVAQQVTAVTGDGGAVQGKGDAFITARVATSSLTGVAAFNDTHFSINEETGYVSLLNAYDPTYVAFENASNVFTSKQYFTAGISAADSIYVGSGLTSIEMAYRAIGDTIEDPTKYTVIKANDRNGMYLLSSNGGATASSILLTSGGIVLGHNTQGGFATVSIGNAIVDDIAAVPLTNYNSRIVMTAYDTFNGSGTFTLRTPTSLGSAVDLTLPSVSGTLALTRNLVSSFNGLTGIVSLTGDGGAIYGATNNTIGARFGSYTLTGVASFDPRFFGIGATGHLVLTGAYQVTGDTIQAGSAINIGTGKVINNIGVTAFNGLTGAVTLTGDGGAVQGKLNNSITTRLTTAAGATGLASFRDTHFLVDVTGHVQLAAAYQATGDTVITVVGSGIGIVTSGKTDTLYNIGVTSFNGMTGNVSLTGDGGAVQGKLNNTITTRLTTAAGATGLASFRDTHFLVDATGHVQLATAYQVTGQTVVAGYGIDLVSSGNTRTINNRGVTSFNGLTGNVSLTGDGGAVQGRGNTFITTRLTTAAGATGLASFRDTHFLVDATGHVQLAAAYQATGDTVITVVGSGIGIVTSGKTDTLYNIGVTGIGFGNDVGLTGKINLTAGSNITMTQSGNTVTISGVAQQITAVTGDGAAIIGKDNAFITARIATDSVTGVASFSNTYFSVAGNGAVSLATAYQVTGDTVQAGSGISIGSGKVITNIGVTGVTTGTLSYGQAGVNGIRVSSLTGNIVIENTGVRALTVQGYTAVTTPTWYQKGPQIRSSSGISVVAAWDNEPTLLDPYINISNTGVLTVNGLASVVTLTGDGGAVYGVSNDTIAARRASYTLTGVASFDPRFFGIGSTGHLVLTGSYAVTGDTVVTVSGSGIGIVTSGNTETLYNIGVTSFNGLTGNVSLTGDGGAVQGKDNNRITTRLGSYTLTGIASFDPRFFGIGSTGHLVLTGSYAVTGDTVQAGSGIAVGTGKIIYNVGVTGIGLGSTDVGLTGKVNITAGTNITFTRSGNTITIASSAGGGATGDTILPDGANGATSGAIWVSTVSGNTKRVTARHTSSVIVTNNGIPSGQPGAGTSLSTYEGYGEGNVEHGLTGVGYFDIAHFVVKPQYGLVQLRSQGFVGGGENGSFSKQFTGLGASSSSDGSLSYLYFDVGNLTFNSATTLDPTNDFILFYDASETGLVKTKRMKSERILLDNDTVFNSKSSQFVKSKSSTNIEFEVLTAPVTANETKLLKSGDAFTYIAQNTVKSLNGVTGDVTVVGNINGCTGAIVITGTTNEVVVSNSCPNITIGLPDNVNIPYLSGTGATFTQTVTATRFIGIVSGGDF